MSKISINLSDITIRTDFNSDDIDLIISHHYDLYKTEYNYGMEFKKYVEEGLHEFLEKYDPGKSRVWICEHNKNFAGCLVLEERDDAAQLRYFLLLPEFRGLGLGKKLMKLFMDFLKKCNYNGAYLWTTNEQESAAALYKRYGFVLTEEIQSDRFGKSLTEQRYDLNLNHD